MITIVFGFYSWTKPEASIMQQEAQNDSSIALRNIYTLHSYMKVQFVFQHLVFPLKACISDQKKEHCTLLTRDLIDVTKIMIQVYLKDSETRQLTK